MASSTTDTQAERSEPSPWLIEIRERLEESRRLALRGADRYATAQRYLWHLERSRRRGLWR